VLAVCSAVAVVLAAVRSGVHEGRLAHCSWLALKLHPAWTLDGVAEGGAGGLVAATGSAGVGANVCLIERVFPGDDCLNNGCFPSKARLNCANMAHAARSGSE
jgi:hypothetical protein